MKAMKFKHVQRLLVTLTISWLIACNKDDGKELISNETSEEVTIFGKWEITDNHFSTEDNSYVIFNNELI